MAQATQEHITALVRAIAACRDIRNQEDCSSTCPVKAEHECLYGSKPDLSPNFDHEAEMYEMLGVINHLVCSNHGYKPAACSACAQAELYIIAQDTVARDSEVCGGYDTIR